MHTDGLCNQQVRAVKRNYCMLFSCSVDWPDREDSGYLNNDRERCPWRHVQNYQLEKTFFLMTMYLMIEKSERPIFGPVFLRIIWTGLFPIKSMEDRTVSNGFGPGPQMTTRAPTGTGPRGFQQGADGKLPFTHICRTGSPLHIKERVVCVLSGPDCYLDWTVARPFPIHSARKQGGQCIL